MWKNANPLKERIVWAAMLLPWWVNLIIAELSFVILYLISSGQVVQIIIPGLFAGASMISTLEADRKKREFQRLRRKQANDNNMQVTKIIVKDLMKGRYKETLIPTETKKNDAYEKYSDELIAGIIVVTVLISTVVVMKVGFQDFRNSKVAEMPDDRQKQNPPPIVQNSAPKQVEILDFEPELETDPVPSQKSWRGYGYSRNDEPDREAKGADFPSQRSGKHIYAFIKNGITYYTDSPANIDLQSQRQSKKGWMPEQQKPTLSYTVMMNNESRIKCKDIFRLRQGMLTLFIDNNLQMEVPEQQIKDIEERSELPGKISVRVIKPDSF